MLTTSASEEEWAVGRVHRSTDGCQLQRMNGVWQHRRVIASQTMVLRIGCQPPKEWKREQHPPWASVLLAPTASVGQCRAEH